MDQLLSDLQNHLQNSPFWAQILVLATSTFVSEDLTTICSGVLVSKDVLSPLTAMLGCFIGIVIGDGGLYLIGLLFGLSALRIPLLSRLLPPDKIAQAQSWFENNGLAIVFISRFLPGTRLPTYFAAGMLRSKAKYFMVAATLASAVWVPMLVGVSWYFGEKMQRFEHQLGGNNWVLMALGVLVLFWFIRTLNKMGSYRARRLFLSRFRRFIRWEFWPITVVYLPLVPYFLWLALRHRSLSAPLYVNPGIGYSGIIGESKHEILDGFTDQREFICNSLFLQPEADTLMRLANLKQWFETRNINFPFILKPDMGQRGSGVGHIENWDQAEAFLKECPIPLVAQEYSPGPFEFGVFYSRAPGEEQGTIWGITGKEFPKVVGDGETNLETLILRHPQGLGRLHIFLKRFQSRLKDVLGYGERLTLVQT
ncbi:MAG: VTT domain-containing protein, partial [Acidobacteria bacterium]|nr:VTT domain-containing protein [Acidobacteriota bacterium]